MGSNYDQRNQKVDTQYNAEQINFLFGSNLNPKAVPLNLKVITSWFVISVVFSLIILLTIISSGSTSVPLLSFLVFVVFIFFSYSMYGMIGITFESLRSRVGFFSIKYEPTIWAIYPIFVLWIMILNILKFMWRISSNLPSIF